MNLKKLATWKDRNGLLCLLEKLLIIVKGYFRNPKVPFLSTVCALPNCQAGECAVFRFFKKTNQERRMNYFAITFREDAIASATGRKAASEAGVKRNI